MNFPGLSTTGFAQLEGYYAEANSGSKKKLQCNRKDDRETAFSVQWVTLSMQQIRQRQDIIKMSHTKTRCGIVVDTWLRDKKVPGSSPGCATSTLSPWERLFTCISSPHSCVKRVLDCRQYARVTRHL